jgi:hypothetical protein
MDTSTRAASRATSSTNGINLIEDDYVQASLVTVGFLISLSRFKEFTNLLLRATDKLIKDLRSIDNLRFLTFECLGYLSGNQCLSRSRWTVEKHSLTVLYSVLLDHALGVSA